MKAQTSMESPARRRPARRPVEGEAGAPAAMRPLLAAFVATAALGLCTLVPCCPAPAPALESEVARSGGGPGVTVTPPAAAGGADAAPDPDATVAGIDQVRDGNASPEPPSPESAAPEGEPSPDLPPAEVAEGAVGQPSDDGDGPDGPEDEGSADAGGGPLPAGAHGDAEGAALAPRATGDKSTGCPAGVSSNPMDVLLEAVERQRLAGADVEVASADPTTGRVVYA